MNLFLLVINWCRAGYSMVNAVVAHGAVDMRDSVAGGAREPGLRLRSIDLILNGLVETAVEEYGVIVATRAPLAPLRGSLSVLHVLDGFAIELVVERTEMV